MNNINIISFSLFVSLSVAACAAQTDVAEETDETEVGEEALTARTSFLHGAWATEGNLEGFNIRPNGEYFYDRTLIMNGMIAPSPGGAPFESRRPSREEGRVTVNTSARTLTFRSGSNVKVYGYSYAIPRTGSPVLMLALKRVNGRKVEGSEVVFKKSESWCAQASDCDKEQADGTWESREPLDAPLRNVCKIDKRCAWEFHAPEPQVLATCFPFILNGIIDPRSAKQIEIQSQSHGPFGPEPTITAVIKVGGEKIDELPECTGSFGEWDLKCTSDSRRLGSVTQFTLSGDETSRTATYSSSSVSPTAPRTLINYSCTLPR